MWAALQIGPTPPIRRLSEVHFAFAHWPNTDPIARNKRWPFEPALRDPNGQHVGVCGRKSEKWENLSFFCPLLLSHHHFMTHSEPCWQKHSDHSNRLRLSLCCKPHKCPIESQLSLTVTAWHLAAQLFVFNRRRRGCSSSKLNCQHSRTRWKQLELLSHRLEFRSCYKKFFFKTPKLI